MKPDGSILHKAEEFTNPGLPSIRALAVNLFEGTPGLVGQVSFTTSARGSEAQPALP